MAKPRIIIADTEASIYIPLQMRFVEEFMDEIDLEIISDKRYFDSLFSTSQNAQVLIVSENLYSSSIQKHDIDHIFLMIEEFRDEDNTTELNVNRLFKYTSPSELMSAIVAKSADSLNINSAVKQEPQVILVTSASGGVGKTTVAMGISVFLTKNHKRVLYINADRMQSFQHLLSNNSPISAPDVYTKVRMPGSDVFGDIKHVIRKEQFCYLPAFKSALVTLGIDYSIYEKIAVSARKSNEYDYIVVDADPVFDECKTNLIDIANKVIILTEQTRNSVYATMLLAASIDGSNGEKFIFACNNFDAEEENALQSPTYTPKLKIDDYIDHIRYYEKTKCIDWAKSKGIQRIALLL